MNTGEHGFNSPRENAESAIGFSLSASTGEGRCLLLRKSISVICRQRQPPFQFIRLMRVHPVVKPAPLRVAAIQFLVGQFACVGATPSFGGETAQHAGPAAVGGFVAVGMQARVEIGNRTPRANEGGFRKSFERARRSDYSACEPKRRPVSSVIVPSRCTVTVITYSSSVVASSKSRSPSMNS